MRNILVAIDLSNVTDAMISLAMSIAIPTKAKIWIVHVAAPDPDFVGFKVGPEYVREQRADTLREEHVAIQGMADRLKEQGCDAEALLVQGPTTDTILEISDRIAADLIIMGSHGRSALFRAFVGSVSEQVLRESRSPVMIVPSPDRG